jgi:hypothetical protein
MVKGKIAPSCGLEEAVPEKENAQATAAEG